MTAPLKNQISNQITLEDNSQFYYTTKPYEVTNALGYTIAVLQEYNFTKQDNNQAQFSCRLHKTKEGNWWDIQETKMSLEKGIVRMLKSAIDTKENTRV